jgi:formyl-CoA transferase/CoA:oxalate CoA-transferase
MTADGETTGALEGVRVLDLGLLVQGPQAGLLLADLGADVIKVELPRLGDQARWIWISPKDSRAPYFIACNRGKRSLTLDLRRAEGHDIFLRLVESADVVISNFLPGTLEGWGLGYEALAARNPRIIFGTGSVFGPVGPDAKRKGTDIAAQAAGGLIRSTGSGPHDVTPVGATIADHIGSQNLCNGVLAALLARGRTGRGQRVDVSLLGGQIYAQASEYTYTFLSGRNPGQADRGHPLIQLIYGVFPTKDGQLAIPGVAVADRDKFYSVIDRPELSLDERYSALVFTRKDRNSLFDELAVTFSQKTTAEWESILGAAGLRYAAVRDYSEVAQDEGVYENGYLQRVEHPEWGEVTMMGCPIRLSDTPARPGAFAPELGEHSDEILLEIGCSREEIGKLREGGVL